MKEQVQTTGVRKWFGDDYTNLQDEINLSLAALLAEYGNCILSGGGVTDNGNGTFTVADGFAFIFDSAGINGKVCRIYSATYNTASYPVFLVRDVKTRTQVPAYGRLYKDGQTKDIINEYYAKFETTTPGHSQYITISTTTANNKRFRDAIQTALFRFVTDSDKTNWNGKLNASSYTAADVLSKLLTVDGTGTGLDADKLDGNEATYFAKAPARRTITGTGSLSSSDNYGIVEMNSASAFNFTIDQMSDGFHCDLINLNTGAVTLVAGSGVTLRFKTANRKMSTQYEGVSIYFRSATECIILGNLSA